ncbi:ribosome biogenesis domain-containing protein [Planctomicrobium sp. SH527]|uniref:ribosome biogenesis domain-containing protein n=1 Tax=Planctomicrobium sp. SH527 TaxID=3448123 RepID=UPI003F5C3979
MSNTSLPAQSAASAPPAFKPTIIVVHPRENRAKCSVEPLRGQAPYIFWTFPKRGPESIESYVRLGIGGPLLTSNDAANGLLLLDGTWRLAARMEKDYTSLPVRSLLPWQTAYPRVSKTYDDPAAGLATVEALFAAHCQIGLTTEGLLDHYYWKDRFLEINAKLLEQCGKTGLPPDSTLAE